MTQTLYVEASLSRLPSTQAGWGACLETEGAIISYSGRVRAETFGLMTLVEIAAVKHAIEDIALAPGSKLEIAIRSTSALALLRWILPYAVYTGHPHVHPPERLRGRVAEAQVLTDLLKALESRRLQVSLYRPQEGMPSLTAARLARQAMEVARDAA